MIPFGDLKSGFDPMLRRLVFLPLAGDNLKLIFDILHHLEGKIHWSVVITRQKCLMFLLKFN